MNNKMLKPLMEMIAKAINERHPGVTVSVWCRYSRQLFVDTHLSYQIQLLLPKARTCCNEHRDKDLYMTSMSIFTTLLEDGLINEDSELNPNIQGGVGDLP